MKNLKKGLSVFLSIALLALFIPVELTSAAAIDDYRADVPENEGVRNAIMNAEQLANISFTPLAVLPQKAGDWPAGKSQKGLPYSSSRIEEGFVPNFVSLYTFMSALKNPNSYLYTVDLARDFNNTNGSTYYGTVCSTFCTYALNIIPNYTTHQWQDIPGMVPLSKQTVDALKLGDTICHKTSGHVVMVVGITRNSLGQVGEVTIAEAATTKAMVRKPYTAEEFSQKYPTDVYAYHRYTKISEVEYIPFETTSYNTDLIPRKGDKANWLAGDPVEIDLLNKNYYTAVEVYKDDVWLQTTDVGGQAQPADRTVYLRDWLLQSNTNNRLTNRLIPIKGDLLISVDTGAQITFDFYSAEQKKIGSAGTWYSGDVSINSIVPDGAVLLMPIVRLDGNEEITDTSAVGAMVSISINDQTNEMPIQLENYSLSSSHGGEVNNNMRCRSAFMPLQNTTIKAEGDVQYCIYYYDEDKEYLSYNGTWLNGAKNVLDGKPQGAAYFRIVIRNQESSVIGGNSYGVYSAKISAIIHGGAPEGGLDVLVLNDLEAGNYKARMTNGQEHSDWCYWMVVDAAVSAVSTGNCREALVSFSASNAEPVFVKWSGGKDNGTKHISVLDTKQKAAGVAVCKYEMGNINDWQYGQYQIRVAFQTEYGIIHTPLQEVTTVESHVYDNSSDERCNSCGAFRVNSLPLKFSGNSVSEDVSGLAFRFDIWSEGLNVKPETASQVDYSVASANGYKLLSMGAVVENGVSSLDIPCVYLCAWSEDTTSFAVRVINIPSNKYDVAVTATPYVVLEIDGKAVTLYGEAQTACLNDIV